MLNLILFILYLYIHPLFSMENKQSTQNNALSHQKFESHENKRVPALTLLSTQAWLDSILALKMYKSPKKLDQIIKKQLKKNQLSYGVQDFLYQNAVPDYFNYTQHRNKTNLKALNSAHTLAVYNEDYYTWPYGDKLKKLGAETATFCPCQSLLVYNQQRSKIFNFLDLTAGELTDYVLNLKEYILPTTAIEHCICHETNQSKTILINPSNTPIIYVGNISEKIENDFSIIDLKHGIIQSMQPDEQSLFYSRNYNRTGPAIYEFKFESGDKIKRTSKHGIINSLTVDRQNHLVVAGSRDHNLYLFDFRISKSIAEIPHLEKVTATASHEPFFAAGTSLPEGKVHLYDFRKIKNSGCVPLMTYSFETSHPSPFMRVQHGPTAQPSISYLSFKTDGSALVIQNESYHGAQSDIFEEFIFEEKSVNLKNLKLIIANYAMKKNKHDENRNEN